MRRVIEEVCVCGGAVCFMEMMDKRGKNHSLREIELMECCALSARDFM